MRSQLARTLTLLLLLTTPLIAQQTVPVSPLEPTQLPARTIFYLIWRGTPVGDIRRTNALLSLWDDPDSAPMRNAMFDAILSNSKKQKDKPAPNKEELTEYASLLDNPFVLGYLAEPPDKSEDSAAAKSSTPATKTATPAPKWNGLFFVYDRTGKEAILSRAVLKMRNADLTDIPKISNPAIAGVSTLRIEKKSGVTFWAETGKFAISANDSRVFEEILNRLSGKSAAHPLSELPWYQEAKPLLGPGFLEVFLNFSQIMDLAGQTTATDPRVAGMLKAVKMDSIHVLAGHLSLEGPKTRLQGAILGTPAPGSLFDIWADGKAQPAALNYLTPGTISITEYELNLPGIYNIVKQAFTQGPNSSPQMIAALESAAQTRLGMPIADALALPTGEVASIQNSPVLDDAQQIRLMGIRNKPEAMKLVRTIMGDKITNEHTEGTTTYMKVSLGGNQGTAGIAQWNFYHLAMTPDLLLGSSRNEALREFLLQPPAPADAAFSLKILAARKQFPEKLNGFTYFDFQKVQWQAAKDKWLADAKTAAAKSKNSDTTDSAKKLTDWLTNVNPELLPRHLHILTGASWKDSTGVHFDEWLD